MQQFAELHDRLSFGQVPGNRQRRPEPPLTNRIKEKCVRHHGSAIRRWRTKLSHHAVAVRDQHGLACRREPDVLAELVLEEFDADRSHESMVATGSYVVNMAREKPGFG
jgi:hypothetical protein